MPQKLSTRFGELNITSAIPRPKPGSIITISPRASIRDVLDVLLTNRIRSAPIIDLVDGKKNIHLIEISDVLKVIIDAFSDDDSYLENDLAYIVENSQKNEKVPQPDALAICNISNNASFIVVAEGSSLLDVATAMGVNGVRRVLAVDSQNEIVNIVTQSTVLELLITHKLEMGSFLEKTLFELELGSKPIVSVQGNETALIAFQKIIEFRISAVAVIDHETEELIGSIDIHDIESLVQERQMIKRLYQRADEFIKTAAEFAHNITVRCTVLNTITEILDMMTHNNVHRVWICNKKQSLLGIITITDLLQATVMPCKNFD